MAPVFSSLVCSILTGAAAVSASRFNVEKQDQFTRVTSGDHEAIVSSISKSSLKWLTFPEQKSLHRDAISNFKSTHDANVLKNDDTFWRNHGSTVGLSAHSEMVLVQEWSNAVTLID